MPLKRKQSMKDLRILAATSLFALCSGSAFADTWRIKMDCVATKNKADMELPLQMILDALAEFTMEGNGIMLSTGKKVSVVKEEEWGTNWQIRVPGSSKIWWISVEFLDVPPIEKEPK
jgi:hypothetical protein